MTASITGCVRDAGGQTVAGQPVKLIHEPTGSAYAKTSGDDGCYTFDAVRAGGPYRLIIQVGDRELRRDNFNVKIGETFTHNFEI